MEQTRIPSIFIRYQKNIRADFREYIILVSELKHNLKYLIEQSKLSKRKKRI